MVNVFTLLLPCLFPSWAFFETIEPSPRLQWRVLEGAGETAPAWTPYRPRPARVSAKDMAIRLFWNPRRNDDLYLVSLAERVVLAPTPHSIDSIFDRIAVLAAQSDEAPSGTTRYLQFRLLFVHKEGPAWVQQEAYVSVRRAMGSDPT